MRAVHTPCEVRTLIAPAHTLPPGPCAVMESEVVRSHPGYRDAGLPPCFRVPPPPRSSVLANGAAGRPGRGEPGAGRAAGRRSPYR